VSVALNCVEAPFLSEISGKGQRRAGQADEQLAHTCKHTKYKVYFAWCKIEHRISHYPRYLLNCPFFLCGSSHLVVGRKFSF